MRNKYVWDHELAGTLGMPNYVDFPNAPQEPDLALLALEPPKQYLKEGSVVWNGPDTRYMFGETGNPRLGNVEHNHIFSDKFSFNYPYVRLISTAYYFLRNHNCMQEKKTHYRSLVYNLETRTLYSVSARVFYNENGAKRIKKQVRKIGLNKAHILGIELFHQSNLDKFINVVKDKVLEDIPGVYDDCNSFKFRLIALNIQHRIGRPIPGLNNIFIDNIQMLVTHERFRNKIDREVRNTMGIAIDSNGYRSIEAEVNRKLNNELGKTLYRFMPTLNKTGSIKKALRILLTEEYYNSIVPKLIHNVSFNNLALGGRIFKFLKGYDENVPKTLKHELARLSKIGDFKHIERLLRHIINMIDDDHINKYIKNAWIRTLSRTGEIINWIMWRDMYNMAAQLGGLRLRPNRFNNQTDVQRLHDTYSTILRARNPNRHVVSKDFMTFLKVDNPEEVFHKDHSDNKYTFIQLLDTMDLRDESDYHGHCVHGYANTCFNGRSVIFRLLINSEPVYTVEYDGETFDYIQAEGSTHDGARHLPGEYVLNEVIIPFSKTLQKLERDKPLNYKVRAGLQANLIKMWADISTLEGEEEHDELITEHLEILNCDLENRTELSKALLNGEISHSDMMEKLVKVDRHTANQLSIMSVNL